MRRYPQVGLSAARRSVSRQSSAEVDGRPGGRCGWVQCRAMRRRCQRNSVSGVTSHPARLGRASAAAIAPSKLRSVSVSSGRSICRRSTASWWRNTMISRSLERPDRTASRASDARNRYKIRYTRTQHRPSSLQVNAHDRVFGTHTHDPSVSQPLAPAPGNSSPKTSDSTACRGCPPRRLRNRRHSQRPRPALHCSLGPSPTPRTRDAFRISNDFNLCFGPSVGSSPEPLTPKRP